MPLTFDLAPDGDDLAEPLAISPLIEVDDLHPASDDPILLKSASRWI